MNKLFDLVEPVQTSELIANYWHFLKSIDEKQRAALGPIEVVLKSRTVGRGWPVGLKNQTLALMTELDMTAKSAVVFIDISEVSSVAFMSAHMVLPFVTAGAVARSPLEKRATHSEAKQRLLQICEEIRKKWSTRIYFDADPTTLAVDELLNLNEVMLSVLKSVIALQENELTGSELADCKGLHVINALDMRDMAVTRRDSGEIELAFNFSRALPKNLDDQLMSLFVAVF